MRLLLCTAVKGAVEFIERADSLSHDMRGPLSRIRGFSSALCDEYSNLFDERGRLYLERIDQTSRQLTDILDELLELTVLSRRAFQYEDVDISKIALEIFQELKLSLPDRDVAFVVTPGVTVKGDHSHLRLLVKHLLENALKFTSKQKRARIEFGVAANDGRSIYFVRDDGVGLDMKYAGKLFKPFHRLHDSADFPGTGIGLASANRIVKRHGGRIWVESEEGKGTTFYFTLGGV